MKHEPLLNALRSTEHSVVEILWVIVIRPARPVARIGIRKLHSTRSGFELAVVKRRNRFVTEKRYVVLKKLADPIVLHNNNIGFWATYLKSSQ